MAAPSPTVRLTPGGIKLKNGFSSLITFSLDPDVSIWEKQVQPIGLDGGEPIDQSTMHNETYRTKAPGGLIDTTNASVTGAYDPAVKTQLLSLINREQTITVEWADGSTEAFYGYVKDVTFAPLAENTQPECTITIIPTNWDHVNKVEAGPVVASVAGT